MKWKTVTREIDAIEPLDTPEEVKTGLEDYLPAGWMVDTNLTKGGQIRINVTFPHNISADDALSRVSEIVSCIKDAEDSARKKIRSGLRKKKN